MAAMQTAGAWEPAPDTNAQQLLREARLDARNGCLPDAVETLNEFELASRYLKVEQILPQVEGQYRVVQDMPLKLPDDQKAQLLSSQQRHVDLKLARVALGKDRRDAEAEQVMARAHAPLGPQAKPHHMSEALRGVAPADGAPR